jgi:hypothetical protein
MDLPAVLGEQGVRGDSVFGHKMHSIYFLLMGFDGLPGGPPSLSTLLAPSRYAAERLGPGDSRMAGPEGATRKPSIRSAFGDWPSRPISAARLPSKRFRKLPFLRLDGRRLRA